MTPERMKEIRKAVGILSELSDLEWEEILAIEAKRIDKSETTVGSSKEEKIRKRISKLTLEIGIPAHIMGYRYFQEAVFIYMTTENPEKMSMTKMLYPTIAKKFETTPSRVERALRHAIDVAWSRGDIDVHNEIFGYTIDSMKGRPNNSEAIATIAYYLK